MAALVTLAEAKAHLRITTTTEDVTITAQAQQATDIILNYLKAAWIDETWTDATVPTDIKAAVLLMLTHLWAHRGDDPGTDAALWEAITRLLMRRRDPALA